MNTPYTQNEKWILFALCLPVMTACIDVMAIGIALNKIINDFSISTITAQWLLSIYTIGIASFLISIGKMADIYGRKKLLLCGLVLFAISSLAAASSHSILSLIIARFLQGVASAIMMTTVVAIINHTFSIQKRTKAISIWGSSLGLGMALGPLIGGIIISHFSWQMIFIVNVPICIFAFCIIQTKLDESKTRLTNEKINLFSAILLSTILILITGCIAEYPTQKLPIYFDILLFIVTGTLLCVFIIREKICKNPLIDIHIFTNKNFTGATIIGFLSYACMYGWLFIFNIYLQQILDLSPLYASIFFTFFSLGFAIHAQIMGMIMQNVNKRLLIKTGFVTMASIFLLMNFAVSHSYFTLLAITFFILGIAITTINAPSIFFVSISTSQKKAGMASGIMFTLRWLGGSIGIILTTLASNYMRLKNQFISLDEPHHFNNATILFQTRKILSFHFKVDLIHNVSTACFLLTGLAILGFIITCFFLTPNESIGEN